MKTDIRTQATFADIDPEYAAFEAKFKPKKTTDDCYTPVNIYEVVADWAAKKYGFDRAQIVRPFWPGADFTRAEYPDGCVVLDNPPFSIMAKILRFYNERGIRYFLFGPALTIFSNTQNFSSNYIIAGVTVTFGNGAKIAISFITSEGEYMIETAPDLRDALLKANYENEKELHRELPKYEYPPAIVTAARTKYIAAHHTAWRVRREDCVFIRKMDAQQGSDKAIFGGGFLLTERAAAERAAAERAAAERAAAERAAAERAAAHIYALSPREIELQRLMERQAERIRAERAAAAILSNTNQNQDATAQ